MSTDEKINSNIVQVGKSKDHFIITIFHSLEPVVISEATSSKNKLADLETDKTLFPTFQFQVDNNTYVFKEEKLRKKCLFNVACQKKKKNERKRKSPLCTAKIF